MLFWKHAGKHTKWNCLQKTTWEESHQKPPNPSKPPALDDGHLHPRGTPAPPTWSMWHREGVPNGGVSSPPPAVRRTAGQEISPKGLIRGRPRRRRTSISQGEEMDGREPDDPETTPGRLKGFTDPQETASYTPRPPEPSGERQYRPGGGNLRPSARPRKLRPFTAPFLLAFGPFDTQGVSRTTQTDTLQPHSRFTSTNTLTACSGITRDRMIRRCRDAE
ncbi:unnamed protein product [Lota lota]